MNTKTDLTALHAAAALFAAQTLVPIGVRTKLAKFVGNSPNDVPHACLSLFAIGALWSLPFVVAASIAWLAWEYLIGDLGVWLMWHYFDLMLGLAQSISAF